MAAQALQFLWQIGSKYLPAAVHAVASVPGVSQVASTAAKVWHAVPGLDTLGNVLKTGVNAVGTGKIPGVDPASPGGEAVRALGSYCRSALQDALSGEISSAMTPHADPGVASATPVTEAPGGMTASAPGGLGISNSNAPQIYPWVTLGDKGGLP